MAVISQRPSDEAGGWTPQDALDLYRVHAWGGGCFSVNQAGHVIAGHAGRGVDLKAVVDELLAGGIAPPLLLRFSDLLQARIALLNGAFAAAIERYAYGAHFQGVYPIKVNQSRTVVAAVVAGGRRYHLGLEAGSKPELLAVMAMLDDPDALVICNGYKDDHYIETALLASKLGPRVVVVVEKPSELHLLRRVSEKLSIAPVIGIRMKLSARGSGKWENSVGDDAKFGLSAGEILDAVGLLRAWGWLDRLQLLHFHMGSQITAIRSVKQALREGTRMYVELVKLGCQGLSFFDVGGGLGVDYDGSQSRSDCSMNYTEQEYANDVVAGVMEVCDAEGVAHPVLVSESGRALVAHHSVLIVEVVGVSTASETPPLTAPPEGAPEVMHKLWTLRGGAVRHNVRECFHDVMDYREQALSLFSLGHLSLEQRVFCERAFWSACRHMLGVLQRLPGVPEELTSLKRMLRDTYYCNFSMFQSLPDSWAIQQLFPVMPIHRLNERPTRRGILADITCDSDGRIDSFVGARQREDALPLHPYQGEPYYLAIMLTGAYQEILGDLHNLFGDTHVAHIRFGDGGKDAAAAEPSVSDRGADVVVGSYQVEETLSGNSNAEVLRYVDYQPEALLNRIRAHIQAAMQAGNMDADEAQNLVQHYRQALAAYTYLE